LSSWVRLWHDMPTDPKWRVISRRSGATVSEVIAVFTFVLVNASANANERGRTHNMFADDIAAALDLDDAKVEAILAAMEGKVLLKGALIAWDKRQPKREDNSADRARQWREEKKAERTRTHANADERPDTDTETDKSTLDADASNGAAPADPPADPPSPIDITKSLFDGGVNMFKRAGYSDASARKMIGKLRQAFTDGVILTVLARAQGLNPAPTDLFSWLNAAAQTEKGKLNDAPAPRGADAGPGPTERAAMAAFGVDQVVEEPADARAAAEPARRHPNGRAIPDARDEE
jgi:hypothetical protein